VVGVVVAVVVLVAVLVVVVVLVLVGPLHYYVIFVLEINYCFVYKISIDCFITLPEIQESIQSSEDLQQYPPNPSPLPFPDEPGVQTPPVGVEVAVVVVEVFVVVVLVLVGPLHYYI
jgi:hypothetical protein